MAHCDSYIFGECTYGACLLAPWIPEGLGDAGDWATDAVAAGLNVTNIPTVSSVVSYARGDGYSSFGHCGFVLDTYSDGSFLVREMNYVAWDQYDDRVSSTYDVAGFILAPGQQPGGAPGGRGGPPGDTPNDLNYEWGVIQTYLNGGIDRQFSYLDWAPTALAGIYTP